MPESHSVDDPVLVGAVVDLVRVNGPDGSYSPFDMLAEGSIDTLFWTKGVAIPAKWGRTEGGPGTSSPRCPESGRAVYREPLLSWSRPSAWKEGHHGTWP